jgi:ParB-like chromosome segregation protein Spo0J
MGTPEIRRYEQRRTRMKIQEEGGSGGPKYQLMPSLRFEEEAALRADIRIRGVIVPVVVDEDDEILDGHHRAAIAKDEGLEYPVVVLRGLDEAGKIEYILALNLARRHISSLQRYELAKQLQRVHGWSNRRIAEHLGVSEATTRRDLQAATASNDAVDLPERVIGRNNRSYPRGNSAVARLRIQEREQAAVATWRRTQERVAPDEKRMAAQARWQARVLKPLEGVLEQNPAEFVPTLSVDARHRTYATVHDLDDWIALAYRCIAEADRDGLALATSGVAGVGPDDHVMAGPELSTERDGETAADVTSQSPAAYLSLVGPLTDAGLDPVESATDRE